MKKFKFLVKNSKNAQHGSTLIEVLTASAIISLALTAASAMTAMVVKLAENNERHQLALQKAQEAMETVRRERFIGSWTDFSTAFNQSVTYCFNVLPSDLAALGGMTGACGEEDFLQVANYRFVRQAEVQIHSADALTVNISMTWQDGSKSKQLNLEQRFENY